MAKFKKMKNKRSADSRERDQFTVVLESIQSDFKIFGEKLEMMDERVEKRFDKADEQFSKLESVLIDIRFEIADLKTRLDKKADVERLEKLEKRVNHLEVLLARRS